VKFKTDENLPVEFCELLRTAGHDAESVFEEKLVGEPDEKIIDVCRDEGRCLITLDLDFSDMRIYPPKELNGLVVYASTKSGKIEHSKCRQKTESRYLPPMSFWAVYGSWKKIGSEFAVNTNYSSSCLNFSSTDRSSSVVTSPATALPDAISRRRRRMILPERVFGSASVKRMSSGFASAPISFAT
jgi:hypothetical protein